MIKRVTILFLTLLTIFTSQAASRQMEKLDRGLVGISRGISGNFLSWRMMGNEKNVQYKLYRNDELVTTLSDKSNYSDAYGDGKSTYHLEVVKDGEVIERSKTITLWRQQYLTVQLNRPAGGTTPKSHFFNGSAENPVTERYPDGQSYTYTPNDMSVGDVDGDGEYELIVKWDPSNSMDNSFTGFSGEVYLDAYKLDGTQLWRIELGKNIRAGAHYTQFMVYDLDGDGRAEVVCKTAPGTIDGLGNYVVMGNDDPTVDYRDHTYSRGNSGLIRTGPEYLTVFDGATGAEVHTVAYKPDRSPNNGWGKNENFNRVDRFLACVAYLDGVKPSVVMCRGYYGRATLAAFDFVDKKLVLRWFYDSGTSAAKTNAFGQGTHSIAVGDVDGDGFDEIMYGSAAIDHDGKLLYNTQKGHGDASHLSDMDPTRPGLEYFQPHEENPYGFHYRDAATGELLHFETSSGDNGRGMAADIDKNYKGFEFWSGANSNVYNVITKKAISTNRPSTNFRIYWDGDLQDELLDGTTITKWNPTSKKAESHFSFSGVSSCNSTKKTPNLSADILGDWREEVILYETADPSKIRIYTAMTKSDYGMYTLMHDPVYRLSIAWQNVAYNQPPHLGIYIGDGLTNIPYPEMYTPVVEKELMLSHSVIHYDPSQTETNVAAVPVGGLSGTVEWAIGDPSIISITKDNKNPNKVKVNTLRQGNTTLTASLDGYQKVIYIVPYGTSLDEVQLKDLVYVAGETIISETDLAAIRLYSPSGALLKSIANPDRVTPVDMPKGLYIAEAIAPDGSRTSLKIMVR